MDNPASSLLAQTEYGHSKIRHGAVRRDAVMRACDRRTKARPWLGAGLLCDSAT